MAEETRSYNLGSAAEFQLTYNFPTRLLYYEDIGILSSTAGCV